MLTLRAHWIVWGLIALAVYMAIKTPSTLATVAGDTGHLLGVIASSLAQFIGKAAAR